MTGDELGALLGISQQHQSRYENGKRTFTLKRSIVYLIFDVEPEYF